MAATQRSEVTSPKKVPLSFRMIEFLDKFFRNRTAPLSNVDSRMKDFRDSPQSNDRDYWESRQYWSMEYEKAYKHGLTYYGRTEETVDGKRVLDIGCGLGGALCAFLDKGASYVVGIEINKRRVRFSQEYIGNRAHSHLLAADASHLPFADRSFDLVLSESTFEHFQEPEGVLKEVGRVLRPGGFLATAFCTPYFSQWHHNNWEIRVPWVDRLFGEETVMEYLRWKYPGFPNQSLREFRNLNGLTLPSFRCLAKSQGLEEVSCFVDGARRVICRIPLSSIPWVRTIKFRGLPLGIREVPLCVYFPTILPFPGHKRIFPGYYQGIWRKS